LRRKFVNIETAELNWASSLDLISVLYLESSEAKAAKSIKTNRNIANSQITIAKMNSGYRF
jgi:hypothetical protein